MIEALLRDPTRECWLEFRDPEAVLSVRHPSELLAALDELEAAVETRGRHAVGFLSYEAAGGFDPALITRPVGELPLLWFALFDPPRRHHNRPPLPAAPPPLAWRPDRDLPSYRAAMERIRALIAAGDTYQVNYTLALHAPFAGDPRALFRQLLDAQPAPYAGYLDTGELALCSASPELFFRRDGAELSCRPMKGTAPRGASGAADRANAAALLHSAKERAENLMIVDMLRNDLGRIAHPGSVTVERLFQLEPYPSLWQLTSSISARSDASLREVLTALFPCASITGAPKARTMAIIAELESAPRGVYTGSLGYLAPGRQAQFNVAIRTALVDRRRGQASYGVGSGLTWDSDPQAEYRECLLKAQVLESRDDFELLETLRWSPQEGCVLLAEHCDRLLASARYFAFPAERAQLEDRLSACSAQLPPSPHKLRLLLARCGALRCEAEPLPEPPQGEAPPLRVALAASPVAAEDPFLAHKTTRREVYRRALAEVPEVDEVLLWNQRGELTETTTANLVVETDAGRFTPPLECGLLPGTLRRRLLEQGEIVERRLPLEMLAECRALYLINSVRGWRRAKLDEIGYTRDNPLQRTSPWNSL